ncbi:unnamed protein product [Oikopleura dioica]|uniref:RING-type domain-containing protein n=1 Tax=Oikopleura dioica TaxID=34765 RepID=E4XMT0_OIKDI|nr:unnamed protein product [Oikopleura dioica]CBY37778.1 unnamed protein product [Oikopleura dioica]
MRVASVACALEFRVPDKPVEQRTRCDICLEEYNREERKESTLYCGHRFCFKCLNELPNKLCPNCSKEYTAEQIIQLF